MSREERECDRNSAPRPPRGGGRRGQPQQRPRRARRTVPVRPSPLRFRPPHHLDRLLTPGRRATAIPSLTRTSLKQREVRATGRGQRTEANLKQRGELLQLMNPSGPGGRARPWCASLLVLGTRPCGRAVRGDGGDLAEVARGREHAQAHKQQQDGVREPLSSDHASRGAFSLPVPEMQPPLSTRPSPRWQVTCPVSSRRFGLP